MGAVTFPLGSNRPSLSFLLSLSPLVGRSLTSKRYHLWQEGVDWKSQNPHIFLRRGDWWHPCSISCPDILKDTKVELEAYEVLCVGELLLISFWKEPWLLWFSIPTSLSPSFSSLKLWVNFHWSLFGLDRSLGLSRDPDQKGVPHAKRLKWAVSPAALLSQGQSCPPGHNWQCLEAFGCLGLLPTSSE